MKRTASSPRFALCLIVIAIALVGCGSRKREADPRLGSDLKLRNFRAVYGTDVFRAELADEGGMSSYGRTRNVLFIDSSGAGRWLLPDNDHVVDEHPISHGSAELTEEERPIAIAALVKSTASSSEMSTLLVMDPTGRIVQKVADGVDEVLGVTLRGNEDCSILYEQRDRKYVVATFAQGSLAKIRDTVVSVPELK